MPAPSDENVVANAKDLLRGKAAPAQVLFDRAKELKKAQRFDLARCLLAKAQTVITPKERRLAVEIAQQRASCTEKDPDLPVDRRSQEAEKILTGVLDEAEQFAMRPPEQRSDAREIAQRQETFGIAGAIHKRRWHADPQPRHLLRSLELYEKGYFLGVDPDRSDLPDTGYTGINAAFVLDLLAQQEGTNSPRGQELRERAHAIRGNIIKTLTLNPEKTRNNWWALATLIEAFFGRGEYEQSREWLKVAKKFKAGLPSWEYETFVKQLAMLATLQETPDQPTAAERRQGGAWKSLSEFVENDAAGLPTVFSGKVGLALSGGGFRASSFFHIGVLARLAELDMLRHVEVLSCVSGGSIIGALYYLHLRNLLEDAAKSGQAEIPREAYIELVRKMTDQFLRTVQTNPRMAVFSKLTGIPSRTTRMGELLDCELYGPVAGYKGGERPRMRTLRVTLPNKPCFNPKYDNWRRRDKVPILILNATTLNTGHKWQFTASFMVSRRTASTRK